MPRDVLLKYHIINTVWAGQSSIIYRATDISNQFVAIKMLLPSTAMDRSSVRIMDREARLALKIDHPNLIRTIEYIRSAVAPAIVMEYFESDNLKAWMTKDEAFIHRHAHDIILQICEALAYLHARQLVHRDMKPENVLVAPDGRTKVIDFALTEKIGGWRSFGLGRRKIAGTRPYIAPETIDRKAPDIRTDIYSLGITIYEMLTGRPPFLSDDRDELLRKHLSEQPTSMRAHRKEVSVKMDELVLHMLSKKPKQRPENIEQVIRRMKGLKVFGKQS